MTTWIKEADPDKTFYKSFRSWLEDQGLRDDAIGDLARDFLRDGEVPKRIRSFKSIQSYIVDERKCCSDCEDALERSEVEYIKTLRFTCG
jgi:hypothetical protein